MGILRVLCVGVLLAAFAGSVSGTPIEYISATTVPSSFTPTGGDFGLGVLLLSGVRPLVLHYADTQTVLYDSQFLLSTSLKVNMSDDGQVRGLFEGGTLRLLDSSGDELLVGEVHSVSLSEFFDNLGILTASGTFSVESGSLKSDFGRNGIVFELMFSVEPRSVEDFSQGFSGFSDLSLTPIIPEPITLTALGIGLVGLIARRRRG